MGRRGEGWVLLQVVLFLIYLAALWRFRLEESLPLSICGAALLVLATAWEVAALAHLGKDLTPLPAPKEDGSLRTDGLYSLVRHPIYTGVVGMLLGGACLFRSPVALAIALLFGLFFDAKSRWEERQLQEHYEDYESYRQRRKRFIPWIY